MSMQGFLCPRRLALVLAMAIAGVSTLEAQETPAFGTGPGPGLLSSARASGDESEPSAGQSTRYVFRPTVPNPFTDEALTQSRLSGGFAMAASGDPNVSWGLEADTDLAGRRYCMLIHCTPTPTPDRSSGGSAPGSPPPADPPSGNTQGRAVSWKLIVPNFFSDQKRIWLFPVGLAEGKHWAPTIPVVATTAALIASDPDTAPYFRNTSKFKGFNHVFKDPTTEWVFLGLPVLWYFGGLVGHSKYAQDTGFLAAETLVDVDFLAGVMRSVDGRLHPRDIPLPQNGGDYTHTWFKAKGTYVNRGSFPSGHTAGAFAAATIFSRRYGRRHRWVPWVAYPLATVTGFSRVSWSAHYPSDVFLGAALAYVIGRYVVLRNAEEPLGDETGQHASP